MMPILHAQDGMNAQLVYSALEDYLAKLDHDLRTRYDNDPRFCTEDVVFLNDAIGRIHLMLHDLKRAHTAIVVKG